MNKQHFRAEARWWVAMIPGFLVCSYFVHLSARVHDLSMLLCAVGTLAIGVIFACIVCHHPNDSISHDLRLLIVDAEITQRLPAPVLAVQAVQEAPPEGKNEQLQIPPPPPEPENPWYVKGILLVKQGKYRDALYCFSYVLQSDPANVPALTAKGECLLKMNQPEQALKVLMQAAGIDEDSPLAKEGKAAVLRRIRAANWQ